LFKASSIEDEEKISLSRSENGWVNMKVALARIRGKLAKPVE